MEFLSVDNVGPVFMSHVSLPFTIARKARFQLFYKSLTTESGDD